MFRKLFSDIFFFLEIVILVLWIEQILHNEKYNYYLFCITSFSLIFNLIAVYLGILLYGKPVNKKNEFIIKNISYKDLITCNKQIEVFYNEQKEWYFFYKGKKYIFNFKYYIISKKRVSDIIFIQYHNHYCNSNLIKNYKYNINFFKKYNIKIKYITKNKIVIRKFKPSLILKLKLLLACTHFKYQRYNGNENWKRDLYDTYFIV